jgi:predicted dehydrogenase
MTKRVRVGILGAGMAGTAHATAFSRLPDVEVTALWSRTRARAEALAGQLDQPGIRVYDGWQDLIERAEVDVISVATPETLRRAPVAMALEQERHVLVEKPFSIELTDAQEMVRLAQRANTVTATCFNWRYAPGAQIAWREVQAGRIGRILDIQMEWRFRMSPRQFLEWLPWAADVSTGPLGGGGSHEFDRARFLTRCEFTHLVGRVVPVCLSQEPEYAVNCGAYMLLAELTDGVLGQFRLTLTTGQPEWRLVLHGEGGTLEVTHQAVVRRCAGEVEATSLEIPKSDQVPEGVTLIQHAWNRLIADFITAVRRGDVAHASVPHLPTLVDGLRAQEVIAAARLSEEERRWVNLREEFGTEVLEPQGGNIQ